MSTDLIDYYSKRAKTYDLLYERPDRKEDLGKASAILQYLFADKEVLEIACGTGYWTDKIAETAESMLATDINESMLEIAKQRNQYHANVKFEKADFYNYQPEKQHESLFGGFIWSHIKLQELKYFIESVNALVSVGGTVAFMDNKYIENSNLPIHETDEEGNTYQIRALEDGTNHLILKNFPKGSFLAKVAERYGAEIEVIETEFYWILKYESR